MAGLAFVLYPELSYCRYNGNALYDNLGQLHFLVCMRTLFQFFAGFSAGMPFFSVGIHMLAVFAGCGARMFFSFHFLFVLFLAVRNAADRYG